MFDINMNCNIRCLSQTSFFLLSLPGWAAYLKLQVWGILTHLAFHGWSCQQNNVVLRLIFALSGPLISPIVHIGPLDIANCSHWAGSRLGKDCLKPQVWALPGRPALLSWFYVWFGASSKPNRHLALYQPTGMPTLCPFLVTTQNAKHTQCIATALSWFYVWFGASLTYS